MSLEEMQEQIERYYIDMENELLRIYEETGESSVFPSRADKYFVIDGVRKDLTADEYVRYATLKEESVEVAILP